MNEYRGIGYFVEDPQLTDINKNEGGTTFVTKFTLAIPDKFKKNKGDELVKRTAHIPFEAYDSGAKVICDNYKKGDPILVYALVKTFRNNIVFRVNHFEPLPYPKRSYVESDIKDEE